MRLCLFALPLLACSLLLAQDANLVGIRPTGDDGKPLNLNFETGDLTDWTLNGEAFKDQPVKGDLPAARRGDSKSNHEGQFWIGGFEIHKDKPVGTLTSKTFKATHPWASFLFAGGRHEETRVEIRCVEDNSVVFKTSGTEVENMYRFVVDLRKHPGKTLFIRLIDQHTGGWGHINFDDFRFHAQEPKFPAAAVAKSTAPMPPADDVKFAGITADQAAKAMSLPPGFAANVFAAEPDVTQPVAMTIDSRGRVWIAQAHNYPLKGKPGEGKDRIVIHEDTDGDGKADKHTIFIEGLNLVSGLEVGFGGVWVGQPPELLFIPDKNGDDKPDGPPQVLLDGWAWQDTHETLNTFTWGPDGWLYGCHGVFTHSKVGKPGTPDAQRIPLNAAVWRFHPTRHEFEIFAHGSSNPWGLDWNDHGQMFITACVIPHLYHIIQGGRYHRQAGQHFDPFTFRDIKTCADHVHWAGGGSPHSGNNRSDSAGGGHAHCGAMFYLADQFPPQYRNALFMANIHGNRLNMDVPVAKGSGYIGQHGPDFAKMNDKWSRLINMRTGPDGSVFLFDWYDKQACHLVKPEIWDHTNGRVYRISYKAPSASSSPEQPKDLTKLSDTDLCKLQLHPNEFFVRHARRILQERQSKEAPAILRTMLGQIKDDVPRHLRVLWALHAIGAADEQLLLDEMRHADPYVRAWAIQLACERATSDGVLSQLVKLAKEDPSPVVRLYIASAIDRIEPARRWDTLKNLLAHEEDAADPNLPLLYWYATSPLAKVDARKAMALTLEGKIPLLREFMARRIAASN